LEHGLCQINGDSCSIHLGLLSFEDLIPTPMKTSAHLSRKQTGESIPSIERTSPGKPGAASHLKH
ncbi:MAG TPA: hypothetical protein VFY31_02030, partial [Macromonas sp.]|nr:hypothetical protein [Macromonas sp.]